MSIGGWRIFACIWRLVVDKIQGHWVVQAWMLDKVPG